MTPLLEADRIRVSRDREAILDGVSVAAHGGELIGVMGPNGAGKSTLLRILAGSAAPDKGAALLRGASILSLDPRTRARRIGYLPQARPLGAAIDVEALVALGRHGEAALWRRDAGGEAAIERALNALDLAPLRRRVALTLSGGELARAHLARALAGETGILILDEPTAALDPKHRLAVMAALQARVADGALIIAALHEAPLAARFCTRIWLMKDGRIDFDGAPQEALSTARLSKLFDLDAPDAAAWL